MVDSNGFIISKRFGTPLKPSKNKGGYWFCTIMMNGKRKTLSVARAVAIVFVDGYKPSLEVNHIDGNKDNNCYTNLEWVTHDENIRHSFDVLHTNKGEKNPNAKSVIACDMGNNIKMEYPSISDAARELSNGSNYRYIENSIWRALSGKRKSYNGLLWKYK